nr:NSP1 [Rotavirus A type 3]
MAEAMSVYKEALYWYNKYARVKNHRLLRNVSVFAWRNSQAENRITNLTKIVLKNEEAKVVTHCLTCCTLTEMQECRVCKIKHVCINCQHSCECFLSDRTTQLRMRTLKYKITNRKMSTINDHLETIKKEHIKNVMKFYNDTFPINDNIVSASRNKVVQHKCRNEIALWAKHLTLPICTLAKVIMVHDEIYYIFGHYENGKELNSPFALINFYSSDLLVDEMNFDRMHLLNDQSIIRAYAQNAFRLTRKVNSKNVAVNGAAYAFAYGNPQYSKRLNFIYTACIRANDEFAVSHHFDWNNIYPDYCELIRKANSGLKKQKLTVRSAIVLQYANSAVHATLLWDRMVRMAEYRVLFCTHWFVDPLDSIDDSCKYTKTKRPLAGITSPGICNMLFELHALMKSIFTVGMYAINGKFSCSNVSVDEIAMLKEEMRSGKIIMEESNFTRWVKSKYVLFSDYSDFVYGILEELDIALIPIENPYSHREQKMAVLTPRDASRLITRAARFIIEVAMSGNFTPARTLNQYCKTDRYVQQALMSDESDISDVD